MGSARGAAKHGHVPVIGARPNVAPGGAANPGGALSPTARGILDSVARMFADRGSAVSMTEIAAGSGVGRATLYRYFPTRQVLLAELQRLAVEEVGESLRAAQLDTLPCRAALDRAVRVTLDVGDHYSVLTREQVPVPRDVADRAIRGPIRAMLARGQAEGVLRRDLEPVWLEDMFVGLIYAGLWQIVRRGAEMEATARSVVAAYLEGAAVRNG